MAKETLFFNITQDLRSLQSQQCNFFLSTIAQHPSRNLRVVQACPLREAKKHMSWWRNTWKKREIKNYLHGFAPIFKMKLAIFKHLHVFIILSEPSIQHAIAGDLYPTWFHVTAFPKHFIGPDGHSRDEASHCTGCRKETTQQSMQNEAFWKHSSH